jgi:hypothetical protein
LETAFANRAEQRQQSRHLASIPLEVSDLLHFTGFDDANALIASDPIALLIGFALDQDWSVHIDRP